VRRGVREAGFFLSRSVKSRANVPSTRRKEVNVMQVLVRLAAFVALVFAVAAVFTASALATGKCNSGRGNLSEGNPSQLILPGTGAAGIFPTVDCDPGNSGDVNRGGD
jgi:predicted ABC-type sugar transport system permease subunit